jgi:putative transposase
MWRHVEEMVVEAKRWSGWSRCRVLGELGVSRTAYYRWRRRAFAPAAPRALGAGSAARPRSPHAILPSEREAVVRYARAHPNPRHRELAWKMVDEGVACLSPSAVYGILREEDLICRWPQRREKRRRHEKEKAQRPDERWQSDIRYIQVGPRRYYLVLFLDEYSRYVVHQEVLSHLDGDTLSLEAQRAIETLGHGEGPKPTIQTDNGSGYVSQEFKMVLSQQGVGHVRIRPHCPEENGLIERAHRTVGEALDEVELRDLTQARQVIAQIVRWYNEERLHSALHFLRPVDYYRGQPATLLEARRRKLAEARHRRREQNLQVGQFTLPFEVA